MNAISEVLVSHPGVDFRGILGAARNWIAVVCRRENDRLVASSLAKLGHPGVLEDYRKCR
jgi:hypothetical protein